MPSFGSLFSGIGGFDLGLERAGWDCAWQVEIDPYCQRVLAERWPGVRRWTDVQTVGVLSRGGDARSDGGGEFTAAESDLGPLPCESRHLDLLVGGFPCQDLSVAGKRAGLAGQRSGLFYEIVRIAQSLQPTWGLFENVPGLLSSHGGRDMAAVLEGLRQCWPVVGYRVLDSLGVGGCALHGRSPVPQRRRRVFFVCGPTDAGVAAVLALAEGGGGHPAAGGEAGADVAFALAASVRGTGDGHGNAWNSTYIARSVAAGSRYDGDTETFVTGPFGGGNDGIGRRSVDDPNLVVDTTQITSAKNYSNPKPGDPCHPLAQGAHPPLLVAATLNSGGNSGGFRTEPGEHLVAHALTSIHGTTEGRDKRENGIGIGEEGGPSFTIDASYPHGIASASLVRRLTPLECERLQDFPDGFTCLCQPLTAYAADPDAAALACTCSDSPRYRALGNAVTVRVIEWLGRRLVEHARG